MIKVSLEDVFDGGNVGEASARLRDGGPSACFETEHIQPSRTWRIPTGGTVQRAAR